MNFALSDDQACQYWMGYRMARGEAAKAGDCTDLFFSRVRLRIPDLRVTAIDWEKIHSDRETDKLTLIATVENADDAPAAASTTQFLLDGSTPLGSAATPPIPAGKSVRVSVGWNTAGFSGAHAIVATADIGDAVDESDELNNDRKRDVIVQGNRLE